jgi:hypothetical protein
MATRRQTTVSEAEQRALHRINAYRATHGVGPVQFETSVVEAARAYAGTYPSGHDPSNHDRRLGENLAWGHGDQTLDDAVDLWYNEVHKYNYSRPGFSMETGHFTALVWKEVKYIGFGQASHPGAKMLGCYPQVIVLKLSPPPNVTGEFPQNVFPIQARIKAAPAPARRATAAPQARPTQTHSRVAVPQHSNHRAKK